MESLTQREIHRAVVGQAEGAPIDIDVSLLDWGIIREPYKAYYGQVAVEDIAGWYKNYGSRLFVRNLRKFINSSEINQSITHTLRIRPDHFWYFNNGVTILCERIEKKAIGGSDRTSGVFECKGLSIVNGAQTVGSIGSAFGLQSKILQKARVLVRFISLEDCPEGFFTDVTRATNTQNRIERRDFAALDPQQERLRTELLLECEKLYVYKTGDAPPMSNRGFTIDDAAIALACAYNLELTVQAKKEVGGLYDDIEKPPYIYLFNENVSALRLWRTVEVLRTVDQVLRDAQHSLVERSLMVLIHGNRFIAHLVYVHLRQKLSEDFDASITDLTKEAKRLAEGLLGSVIMAVDKLYPDKHLNSLFKNVTLCRALRDRTLTLPTEPINETTKGYQKVGGPLFENLDQT